MQAILTRAFAPTNHRSGRVSATAVAGRTSITWDDHLSVDQNHAAAAKALTVKFKWHGDWIGGILPNGDHVWTSQRGGRSGPLAGEVFAVARAV